MTCEYRSELFNSNLQAKTCNIYLSLIRWESETKGYSVFCEPEITEGNNGGRGATKHASFPSLSNYCFVIVGYIDVRGKVWLIHRLMEWTLKQKLEIRNGTLKLEIWSWTLKLVRCLIKKFGMETSRLTRMRTIGLKRMHSLRTGCALAKVCMQWTWLFVDRHVIRFWTIGKQTNGTLTLTV